MHPLGFTETKEFFDFSRLVYQISFTNNPQLGVRVVTARPSQQ
jgi:hypothetical protein